MKPRNAASRKRLKPLKNKNMKGYIFYLTHFATGNGRKGENKGNCIAVHTKPFFSTSICRYVVLAAAPTDSVNDTPNTNKLEEGRMIEVEYIKKNCTKITQEEAAIHHPNLFSFLGINI